MHPFIFWWTNNAAPWWYGKLRVFGFFLDSWR